MLELVPLRDRPDLRTQVFSEAFMGLWPTFMLKDPSADLYFEQPHLDAYLDTAFAVVDSAQPDVAVGRAFAVHSPSAFLGARNCQTKAGTASSDGRIPTVLSAGRQTRLALWRSRCCPPIEARATRAWCWTPSASGPANSASAICSRPRAPR